MLVGLFFLFEIKQNNKSLILEQTPQPSSISSSSRPSFFKEISSSRIIGKIAFVLDGEIWTVNADGENLKKITNDQYYKSYLSISPDGQKIAFAFYPKDESKRTDSITVNNYQGSNTGLGSIDLNTNQTQILIPYGNIQNYFPTWSLDNRYISIWVGSGKGSKIIETSSGNIILSLGSEGGVNTGVSPIVWMSSANKISFIENGSLIISNADGSNKETIATGVDSFVTVFEAPSIPQPPFWSKSGRYVTFYKHGDLYLRDVINNTSVLIGEALELEDGPINYSPAVYSVAFNLDETKLYLGGGSVDYLVKGTSKVLDIVTGKVQEIADLGESLTISPNKQILLGLEESRKAHTVKSKVVIINLSDNSKRECPGELSYTYPFYANWLIRSWSPDSKAILNNTDTGLQLFNIEDCTVFNLIDGKEIWSVVWFP